MGDRYAQVSGTKEVQRGKETTLFSNLIRWGALAALASGVLWIVGGLLTLAYPHTPPDVLATRLDYLGTSVFSAAYLGVLGGVVGLHARQIRSYGRPGRVGFLLAFIGAALLCVGRATSAIFAGGSTLGWLFDDPGYGFVVVGLLWMALGYALYSERSASVDQSQHGDDGR